MLLSVIQQFIMKLYQHIKTSKEQSTAIKKQKKMQKRDYQPIKLPVSINYKICA